MRINRLYLVGGLFIILLILCSCAPKTTPHPPTVTVQVPNQQPVATQADAQNNQNGEQTTPVDTQAIEATVTPGGLATDIPIMEGAYQLQTMRNGNSVIYQVDSDTETVVKFYADTLPNYGWESAGPPDSVVGSIASMLRENKDKDRLTINMQGNTLGGFVKITIQVVRGHSP